ncbi:MAG: hypothetical protein GQ565_06115 [Candidatus Aegiribacteria sp.]|nr:hypothetical protein [Candidatus Aegiribacteria sp.]
MLKIVLLACILMFFILPLQAENVFIWNYDAKDVFNCTEAGGSISSAYWIEQTLTFNGHTFNTDTLLPTDLSTYDVVFVLTGWYSC